MKIQEWKRNELNHDEEDLEEGHDCAIHAGKTHEEWLEEQSE